MGDGYGIIYKATSPSGKVYIGQTIKTLHERIKEHSNNAHNKNYVAYGTKFYKAIRKYSVSRFVWKIILCGVPFDKMDDLETNAIKNYNSYKNGYNSTLGGNGIRGFHHSEKIKRKLSILSKKRVSGKRNPMYGKKCSKERAQKISDALSGMRLSSKVKNKISKGTIKASLKKLAEFLVYDADKLIYNGKRVLEFCKERNFDPSGVYKCLKGRRKIYKGLRFVYKNDKKHFRITALCENNKVLEFNSVAACANKFKISIGQVRYGLKVNKKFSGLGIILRRHWK